MNERDFKGIWIPKEIYLNRKLSWTEKILLVEIDSLDKGKGCFASNEYLGKFLGKSTGQIANIISKLRSRKLLFTRHFDGRKRFISCNPDLRKTLRQTSGKPEGRSKENLKYSNTDNNIKDNTVARKRGDGRLNPSFGICQSNNSQNPFDIKCTNRLIKILQIKRKIMRRVNEDNWIRQFKKLRVSEGMDKRRIKQSLNWYIKQDFNDRYLPKAYSAESFRKKFLQIEDKMNQNQDPKRRKNYKPGDPEDDFPTETTSWVTKDGRKRSRIVIDES